MAVSTQKVVTISFLVDVIDIVTNLIVAVISGSAVVFAEAVQGMTDAIGSLLLIIGHSKSKKPVDVKHPFGHAREVFFWTLLSALIMFVFGSGLTVWRGYNQLISGTTIHYKALTLGVLSLSMITNGYALSLSYRKLKKPDLSIIHSFFGSRRQLVKTAFLRDGMGTLAAFIGFIALVLYEIFNLIIFDAIGAIVIGVLMAGFAWYLIGQNKHLIVGESVSEGMVKSMRQLILKLPEVEGINNLYAVYEGNDNIVADADIVMKENLTTLEIENVLDRIQTIIQSKYPEVKKVRFDLNSPK